MKFFCYHRDRPGSGALRLELLEEHWSYMDRYASEMIARGPTFVGDTITGSVHIVDLADPGAARSFAFDEPGYQAGVYRDVLLRRWRNVLGRTMWDFSGRAGGNRYLVLGLGSGQAADLAVAPDSDELIVTGPCSPTTTPPGWAQRRWSARLTGPRRAPSWPRTGTPRSRSIAGGSGGGLHESEESRCADQGCLRPASANGDGKDAGVTQTTAGNPAYQECAYSSPSARTEAVTRRLWFPCAKPVLTCV